MDKNNAFTFIELLIIIGVMIIFTGISLAYYNNFTDDMKLKTATANLINVLNLAQKRASSGDIANTTCTNFTGYTILLTASSYSMKMECTSCSGSSCLIQNNLSNITLSSNPSIASFLFKPLAAGTNLSANTDIILTRNSDSKCRKININIAGLINESPTCP